MSGYLRRALTGQVCLQSNLFQHKLGGGMLAKILISVISALSELSIHMSECMDYTRWSRFVTFIAYYEWFGVTFSDIIAFRNIAVNSVVVGPLFKENQREFR